MSAPPGRIKAIVPIELQHPRQYKMKTSNEFSSYKARGVAWHRRSDVVPGALHEGEDMQRKLVVAVMIATPILGCATSVSAQTAKSVAGTYSGVSFVTTDASGNTTPTFGDNPRAMMVLTPQGRYSIVVMREDLPKFAANSRLKGTPEEYKAVVEGSIAHFGRYTIDDKGKSITFHIENSTFPNWDGMAQKRPLTIKGGALSYKVPAASGGGSAVATWMRIK